MRTEQAPRHSAVTLAWHVQMTSACARLRILLIVLSAAAGCDAPPSFASAVPAEAVATDRNPTADEDGYRVASIDLHAALPARAIALESRGVVGVVPDDGDAIPAVHVSVALAALDLEVPWTLDADTAQIAIDGKPLHVLAASSDLDTLPIAMIPGGERHAIELYFASPAPLERGALQRFELSLLGSTAAGPFDVTATFVRGRDASSDVRRPPLGDQPYWWFDPTYAWPRFRDQDGIITSRPPTRATILDDSATSTSADEAESECAEW